MMKRFENFKITYLVDNFLDSSKINSCTLAYH